MAYATRLGDYSTGHDSCKPVPLVSASGSVFINGLPLGRQGDLYDYHSCDNHSAHQDSITGGSSSVFINGKPAARVGDACSRGAAVRDGSGNVRIGG